MKNVDNRNFNIAVSNYLSEVQDKKFYFDGTLENEVKYLKHNKVRYYITLKKLENVIDKISHKDQIEVLEIGFSPMAYLLNSFLDKETLTVLDHNEQLGQRIRAMNIEFVYADLIHGMILEKKFDVILFNEVFEHIYCNEEELLGSIVKNLKLNGYLLFSTPNFNALKNLLLFLSGHNLTPLHKEVMNSDGSLHVREYLLSELLSIFEKFKGIQIIDYAYERYYENPQSVLVYSNHKSLLLIPALMYSLATLFIPKLRRCFSITLKVVNGERN